jgi:hypothetical protein
MKKKNTTKTSSKNASKLKKLSPEQLKQISGGGGGVTVSNPNPKPATY